jgi:dGTPase
MTIRSRIEERESLWLCPAAARSRSADRMREEAPSELRTAFQRDRDRIIHSKAFRRLKFKTQVFLSPDGDHFRTRLTHTLEVTQIARTIARALDLNEDLAEAIGLAHDLGHTPFGHVGERALARVFPDFRHNEQSLRVVDVLEKDGLGLNLTNFTRDGILHHSKPDNNVSGEVSGTPGTAEAQVVKLSDSIAYMNHDFDDALRGGILEDSDLPSLVRERLGASHSSRIDQLVRDVVQESQVHMGSAVNGRQVIIMSTPILEAANLFRSMLFERVYRPVNDLPSTQRAGTIVEDLFRFFVAHPSEMQSSDYGLVSSESVERQAADVVAGMTDRFALAFHSACNDSS